MQRESINDTGVLDINGRMIKAGDVVIERTRPECTYGGAPQEAQKKFEVYYSEIDAAFMLYAKGEKSGQRYSAYFRRSCCYEILDNEQLTFEM